MVISLWRIHPDVVIGLDSKFSSDDLPDEVRDLASHVCLAIIISICNLSELVDDELWCKTSLDEVLHDLAKKFSTFDALA